VLVRRLPSTPFVVPMDPANQNGPKWVFFRGTDNALWRVADDGTQQWHITSPTYGQNYTNSMPFVLPDPDGGNCVFFQGTKNELWKVHDDGSRQSQIGNNTTNSTPFAVPDPAGGAWVFFQGTDNALWKIKDDGTQQSNTRDPETPCFFSSQA
jgi:hypothetical protein